MNKSILFQPAAGIVHSGILPSHLKRASSAICRGKPLDPCFQWRNRTSPLRNHLRNRTDGPLLL